jgi:hypothetical protein
MAKDVSAQPNFVESPEGPCNVLQWFRDQDLPPDEHTFDWGVALHFSSLAQLRFKSDGKIDSEHSPVITVNVPRVLREYCRR